MAGVDKIVAKMKRQPNGISIDEAEKPAKKMKNAEYYMSLPYTTIIEPISDESGFYYAGRIMELEGCMTDGETKEGVLQNLQEAMELWLESKLENGHEVPEPAAESKATGKFTLRLPKSLHQRLTLESKQEGVSLNQYALYKLSR